MPTRLALGKRGEQLAADYLKRHGYLLVDANWRRVGGEFDLIARQGETLVFVEVRTRREGLEAAFASISPRKRSVLERLAYRYLHEHDLDVEWRIDVIAIATDPLKIEHIENALDW